MEMRRQRLCARFCVCTRERRDIFGRRGLSLEIDRKEEDIPYHDLWSKGTPIHTKDSDE